MFRRTLLPRTSRRPSLQLRVWSWSCQEMLMVDPAPSLGARHLQGGFHVPEEPGLGVSPELSLLGEPFAVYSG